MHYKELNDKIAELARLSFIIEEKFIESEGELTEEIQALEEQKQIIAELLAGEGIDDLGRWLKSKEDELKTYKAEKDAVARRIKSVENTIDFVKAKITEVMVATGTDKAKGLLYGFTKTVSNTTKVDMELLNGRYQELAERAIRAAGVPDYVTMKLDAKVSLVPEGEELPDLFEEIRKDTVRFSKPRAGKE